MVNINEVDELLKYHEDIVGITPRWYLFGNISNPDTEKRISAMIVLVDPERERSIGLGRNFNYPPLE